MCMGRIAAMVVHACITAHMRMGRIAARATCMRGQIAAMAHVPIHVCGSPKNAFAYPLAIQLPVLSYMYVYIFKSWCICFSILHIMGRVAARQHVHTVSHLLP